MWCNVLHTGQSSDITLGGFYLITTFEVKPSNCNHVTTTEWPEGGLGNYYITAQTWMLPCQRTRMVDKGRPKISTFSRVYKTYIFGEGGRVCENHHFFHTLLAWFLLFTSGFLELKYFWCVLLFWWDGVSESVWFVHSWKC